MVMMLIKRARRSSDVLDRYVESIDCGDGFMDVHFSKPIKSYSLNMGSFVDVNQTSTK